MEEGTLINWLVNEGDVVSVGDEIAEIESSKIVNVLETHIAGTVRRKVLQEDETLPVGGLLAVIADTDVTEDAIDAFISSYVIAEDIPDLAGKNEPAPSLHTEPSPVQESKPASGNGLLVPESLKQGPDDGAIKASPHARRLAQESGINLNNVNGSGRGGRISVTDIEQAVVDAGGSLAQAEQTSAAEKPDNRGNEVEKIAMSSMRKTIASRLQESKQTAPHFRLVVDVEIDALLQLRQRLNQERKQTDAKISVNNMLIKACAMALVQVPDCNVQFHDNTIHRFRYADISVAVALDSGLITPVIKAADSRDIVQISNEVSELVDRARAGKLEQDEFEGGTFTISNLGMYGIRQFDAIINQPQGAILAVGGLEQRVVARDGTTAIASVLTLSLSLDHRIIDGVTGARFLQALTKYISNPDTMTT